MQRVLRKQENQNLKLAKDALRHAWTYAYRDRKVKKRTFRNLWNLQINALAAQNGITYSRFIDGLKKNKIELDRKVLSELANEYPEVFVKIVEEVKTNKIKNHPIGWFLVKQPFLFLVILFLN